MDELKLTGNSLKGARPFMLFDASFDSLPHLRLLRELFQQTYGTPRNHLLSKPFVDRVTAFFYVDGKVWFRNYQISHPAGKSAGGDKKGAGSTAGGAAGGITEPILTEIGPRFVLNLVRIFSGPFGGPTLYQNPNYVSPNTMRAELKRQSG